MHICHVASVLKGGPATAIRQLITHQLAQGHRVTLIFSTERDDETFVREMFPDCHAVLGWPVGRDIGLSDIKSILSLHKLLAEVRPDIAHLHCSKAGAAGRLAATVLGIPRIYMPHGISYLRVDVSAAKRLAYLLVEKALLPFGDHLVACSLSEYEVLERLGGRRHFIPNGIDLDGFDALLGDSRPPAEGFRIAICGRINESKAPHRVAAIARQAPPDWEFWWIGDGHLRHVVEETGRVKVLGWQAREDGLKLMRQAHVLLHASAWEGMPFAILEAMAAGMPVVASNIVGNRDLVRHGKTGSLISEQADYVPALKALADSPALRDAYGTAGRQVIESDFSLPGIAQSWMGLYQDETGTDPRKGHVLHVWGDGTPDPQALADGGRRHSVAAPRRALDAMPKPDLATIIRQSDALLPLPGNAATWRSAMRLALFCLRKGVSQVVGHDAGGRRIAELTCKMSPGGPAPSHGIEDKKIVEI